jgi:PadR family transcriptional regulator, regulatory protein PadR
MPKELMPSEKPRGNELIPGTLEALILKALTRGELHGYAISDWIYQASAGVLQVEEGALYPALHRLELRGLLKSRWGVSDTNRRVKLYVLTAAGRRKLDEESKYWNRMTAGVMRVLEST